MSKNLKIVSLSAEMAPYSKTGGLADVTGSLPRALNRLEQKVICVTPLYGKVIDKEKFGLKLFKENIELLINGKNKLTVNYWQAELTKGVKVYFVENEKYFSRKKELYGSSHENFRFFLFNFATLKLLTILKFAPDIIQCHDWHAGLVPYLLKHEFKDIKIFQKTATVFTIHNLVFQLGHPWWEIPADERDDGKTHLPLCHTSAFEKINFAKRAILDADLLNTVSETYAEEIIVDKDKGQDLHILLRNRADRLFGIINGIEHSDYNPATDPGLQKNYNYKDIKAKETNKLFVQKKFGFPADASIPLLVMTSRITHQKGFELILEALPILLHLNIQMIIMGDGDKDYTAQIKKLIKNYPQKIAWTSWAAEGPKYETSLYAAGDIFLLPSTFEPCGINQMKALRYGCVPVVRSIGGLKDTITNFDYNNPNGNGFTFFTYSPLSLYGAIVRALEYYKNKKIWAELVKNGMQLSFSWNLPAALYLKLFNKALKIKNTKQ